MINMPTKIYNFILASCFSFVIHGALCTDSAKAFSANDYKSIPSKKIIELKFDIREVSKYIVHMVNTSKQPLACKLQAYYDIAVIDALNQGKVTMEGLMASAKSDEIRKAFQKSIDQSNEQSFQVLDRELRILDNVCQ